jgi:hypothetical protein
MLNAIQNFIKPREWVGVDHVNIFETELI